MLMWNMVVNGGAGLGAGSVSSLTVAVLAPTWEAAAGAAITRARDAKLPEPYSVSGHGRSERGPIEPGITQLREAAGQA